MIGHTSIGEWRHVVELAQLQQVADGDGGMTDTLVPLVPPAWKCSIAAATARNTERVMSDATIAAATHVLKGRYRPDVNAGTVVTFGARRFDVVSAQDIDERRIALVLVCSEVLGD